MARRRPLPSDPDELRESLALGELEADDELEIYDSHESGPPDDMGKLRHRVVDGLQIEQGADVLSSEDFLTRQMVAKLLHVHAGTVSWWIRVGWLRAYRPGARWLVSRNELLQFLKRKEIPTCNATP